MAKSYDLNTAPVIITQHRSIQAACAAFAWTFALVSILKIERSPVTLALCGLFFTWAAVVLTIGIFRPGRLTLSPSGLEYRGRLRTKRWAWDEVGEFVNPHRAVTFYDPNARTVVSRINAMFGVPWNEGFPSGWPLKGSQLCSLLNDARTRWT